MPRPTEAPVSVTRGSGRISPTPLLAMRDPEYFYGIELPYGEVYPELQHRYVSEIATRPDVAAQMPTRELVSA
jgi:hypothetical protein